MKKLTFVLFIFLFVAGSLIAQNAPVLPTAKGKYVEEELLLVVPTSAKADVRSTSVDLLETWGYTRQPVSETKLSNITISVFKSTDRSSSKTVRDAVTVFNEKSRGGAYLVPNIKLYAFDNPNDPCFNRLDEYKDKEGVSHDILLQWGLKNTGDLSGIVGADLNVIQAWGELTNNDSDVVVAVIDTGVDVAHPNISDYVYKVNNHVVGYNALDQTTSNYEDDHGHGTHCAGSIVGGKDDNEGTAGVAGNTPSRIKAYVMPIKALGADGSGDLNKIVDAMKWAGTNGANMISMSLGAVVDGWQEYFVKSLFDDALASAELTGVVVVAAAGNDGKDVHAYPAYCDAVIAIAAYGSTDELTSFSNFGTWVDVASPGLNVVSARAFHNGVGLDMYRDAGYDKTDYTIGSQPGQAYGQRKYYIASGTSMACPNAAGVVAMMLSVKPGLSTDQVRTILKNTSANKTYYQQHISSGRVDAYEAVKAAKAAK